jgi:hypothetical protein
MKYILLIQIIFKQNLVRILISSGTKLEDCLRLKFVAGQQGMELKLASILQVLFEEIYF